MRACLLVKHLVVRPHAGLGNRIRALVSARRVARKLNRRLAIQWPIDSYHCGCHFNALFNTSHFLVGDAGCEKFVDRYSVAKSPTIVAESDADVVHVLEENFFWHEMDDRRDVFWGQLGPHLIKDSVVKRELADGFAALSPNEYVSAEVRAFHDEYLQGNVIGCHVRREDNEWSNEYCQDEMFVRPIELFLETRQNARVFLCTDGQKSRDFFNKRFYGHVVEYPVRSLDRGGNWRAVQDAFIAMLLLSMTTVIVRSNSSTFSQCAAWFGNLETINIGRPQHER